MWEDAGSNPTLDGIFLSGMCQMLPVIYLYPSIIVSKTFLTQKVYILLVSIFFTKLLGEFNKLTSIFHPSVLLLILNFVITLSK